MSGFLWRATSWLLSSAAAEREAGVINVRARALSLAAMGFVYSCRTPSCARMTPGWAGRAFSARFNQSRALATARSLGHAGDVGASLAQVVDLAPMVGGTDRSDAQAGVLNHLGTVIHCGQTSRTRLPGDGLHNNQSRAHVLRVTRAVSTCTVRTRTLAHAT
jgi:hypothetical protein